MTDYYTIDSNNIDFTTVLYNQLLISLDISPASAATDTTGGVAAATALPTAAAQPELAGWDQASDAAPGAEQALETAVAGGSATDISTALLGLIEPTYQALGPDLESNLIDLGTRFFTGVDPLTAGLDTVSAVDPAIIADVLSSVGF